MANWYGSDRTNFVSFSDVDALRDSISLFPLELRKHSAADAYALFSLDEYGGWPTSCLDDDDAEIEFSFERHVAPFLKPGAVLVAMETGSEQLRYLTGSAQAFTFDGNEVKSLCLNLDSIYGMAEREFGSKVAVAQYSDFLEA